MKHKIILLAMLAMLVGTFSSCDGNGVDNYPSLYVVNGTDYAVNVYCDNQLVVAAWEHNNSETVVLSNISVNSPIYVTAEFYDTAGNIVDRYEWSDYYFQWNKTYKMTLTSSSSTSIITAL